MGYNAIYAGSMTFNEHTAENVIDSFIDFLGNIADCEDCYKIKLKPVSGNGTQLRFSGYHDHYHSDDWDNALEAVRSCITEGCIIFTGEENVHWRRRYDPDSKAWNDEDGHITYADNNDMETITEALHLYAAQSSDKTAAARKAAISLNINL